MWFNECVVTEASWRGGSGPAGRLGSPRARAAAAFGAHARWCAKGPARAARRGQRRVERQPETAGGRDSIGNHPNHEAWPELFAILRLRGILLGAILCTTLAQASRYVESSVEVDLFETAQKAASSMAGAREMNRTNHRTLSLLCTVGTNEWQIEGNFPPDTNVATKWFFDGTNVYRSLRVAGSAAENAGAPYERDLRLHPQLASNLTITVAQTPGGYPLDDATVNIPWLALCSGSFLKRADRIIPLPVALLGYAPDAFAYRDETQTFEDELGLPLAIDLFTSERLYQSSVAQFRRSLHRDYPSIPKSGLQDGLRKFHYSVSASTNFAGWGFPLAFEFSEDIPHQDGLVSRRIYGSGRVIRVGASARPAGVFDPRLHQVVIDARFASTNKQVNAIIYRSTNGFAAPTNDPVLQSEFARRVERAPYTPAIRAKHASAKTAILRVILILTLATPLAFLVIRKMVTQKQ
jgi:hypothetical protein